MALNMSSDTMHGLYTTYDQQYYNELAKAYALSSQYVTNQTYSAPSGNVYVSYVHKSIGKASYVEQIVKLNGYETKVLVANINPHITTDGIYLVFLTPTPNSVINEETATVEVIAKYIHDGQVAGGVDDLEVSMDINSCSVYSYDSDNYVWTFHCPTNNLEGVVQITASASKQLTDRVISDQINEYVIINPVQNIYITWLVPSDGATVSLDSVVHMTVSAVTDQGDDVDSVEFYVNDALYSVGQLITNHEWIASYAANSLGTIKLTAKAQKGNITVESTIYIKVVLPSIKIVDVVPNIGDNDFQLPDQISKDDNYVVVELDSNALPYKDSLKITLTSPLDSTVTYCSEFTTQDGRNICYAPIPSDFKKSWCPLAPIDILATMSIEGYTISDEVTLPVSLDGPWVITQENHYTYDITKLRVLDTGNVILSVPTPLDSIIYDPNYSICGYSVDMTDVLQTLLGSVTSTVKAFNMEKIYDANSDNNGSIWEAKYRQYSFWGFTYFRKRQDYAVEHPIDNPNYWIFNTLNIQSQDGSFSETKQFSFNVSGTGSVSFDNINKKLSDLNFTLTMQSDSSHLPYCSLRTEGNYAYIASEYDVPTRFIVYYYDDQYRTEIYPISFCTDQTSYTRQTIQITINKSMVWYAMNSDSCYNGGDTIVGKVYLTNIPAYTIWDYKILILYNGSNAYANIYNNNCSLIQSNIPVTKTDITRYEIGTINMTTVNKLDAHDTIYYWIEFNPKQPISGSIDPVVTATYTTP
jgi:hypothetical protein